MKKATLTGKLRLSKMTIADLDEKGMGGILGGTFVTKFYCTELIDSICRCYITDNTCDAPCPNPTIESACC